MMRLSIGVLAVFIIVMLLVLICMAMYIAGRYEKKRVLTTRKNDYLIKILPVWHDYLVKNKELDLTGLKPISDVEYEVTEKILLCYVKNLSNREIQVKIKDFANEFLTDYYSLLLRSKKWSLRMNALYRISAFQLETLLEECRHIEEGKCTLEELRQIHKIYSILDFEYLAAKLRTEKESFEETEYRRLLNVVSENDLKQMVTSFEEFPYKCQLAIVDVLGFRRQTEYIPFFEKQLLHRSPEMRIRSLKAVYETGWIIDVDIYLHFVQSPIWEERLLVTKLLGRLPLKETFIYLQKLLEDQTWRVRSEAAKTIGNIKEGNEKLMEFVNITSDRYARDIANEVLRKGT